MVCKVYTDVGDIVILAKARGLSPRTGGQPMVHVFV